MALNLTPDPLEGTRLEEKGCHVAEVRAANPSNDWGFQLQGLELRV